VDTKTNNNIRLQATTVNDVTLQTNRGLSHFTRPKYGIRYVHSHMQTLRQNDQSTIMNKNECTTDQELQTAH